MLPAEDHSKKRPGIYFANATQSQLTSHLSPGMGGDSPCAGCFVMKIKLPSHHVSLSASVIAHLSLLFLIWADADAGQRAGTISSDVSTPSVASATDTRYGLFNLLDHRSTYGEGVFPEPFLVDDSVLEDDEDRK